MKYCLLLLALLFFSKQAICQTQTEPFASQWKQADSLIDRGLPESARKIVDRIYAEAQAKDQEVQMLKAQLYLMRINAGNQEDADSLNIAFAESQIRKTDFPINAVWRSIAAQLYWNYYQRNRYRILSRTRTSEAVGNDFEQWDASRFFARSTELYITSLGQAAKLKRISIDSLDPVLVKGVNTRNLRPTLFDLLAFRAIDFFENDEKDLTQPAYRFVMDDAAAFAPAADFIRHSFSSKDTFSAQRLALTLYQQVLAMHINDANPDAFIDADLQRLQFAYQHSVHPDKKDLYRKALESIEKKYTGNPLSALASFRIAELMMSEQPILYDEGEDDDEAAPKSDLRAVKAKLDSIIAKYPESEGGIAARQLQQRITAPMLSLTAEEAVLPGEPSKILVTYKNVPKAYIQVHKMDADVYFKWDRGNENDRLMQSLLRIQPVQAFSVALPGTEDYAQHHAEVKIDALPLGMYAIVISAKESFSKEDNALSYAICQSTQLAVVTQSHSPSFGGGVAPVGYVLHRRSGEPVANASVSFFKNEWNRGSTRYIISRAATVSSGSDGAFRVKENAVNYAGLMVKKDDDAFYSSGYLGFYRNQEQSQESERTFFFTDRSIYRPGQKIFFKAIVVKTSAGGRSNEVMSGKKIEVTFYDANSQEIATQTLTTNEWGSVAGSFTAPQSGLTGQMRLEAAYSPSTGGGREEALGSVYFSVEEYKRPKFRVDWDTLKTDYALGEQVSITGYAQAYAGNNLDGATVKYRVVRNVRWPYWWYAWKFLPGPGRGRGEQQMAEGTTTTDANGKFIVRFTALPDKSIDERSLPVFTYTVYADVTDLNGETRSGQKSISAGYRSLQIVADIPEQASRKDLDTLRITTQNLNGDFVPASVRIKVARLEQPDVIYRKRYWPVPDQFVMSEAEFRKNFPLDAYKDEDDYRNWKDAVVNPVLNYRTSASGQVSLPTGVFGMNGWYCITISAKDKNGKPVEEKKFVQVWDRQHDGMPYTPLLALPQSQQKEPGETAAVEVASGFSKLNLIQQVQTMSEEAAATQHLLTQPAVLWTKAITEADRGGIALSYITVKDNRVYTASARIEVPWTNKDLSIEWETHRDKLQPGAKETWTMIVRGNKKDKVAAELAAALYDASLDAFKPHSWGIGNLFPTLDASLDWNTRIGFGEAAGTSLANFQFPALPSFEKSYDQLIKLTDYSQRLYYADGVMLKSEAAGRAPAPMRAAANVAAEDPVTGRQEEAEPGAKPDEESKQAIESIPIRKNLQETAFFYPQLHTDADGAVRISFTMPEALTEWKLLAFAHTKDMRTGYLTGRVKTQKDLMVQPGLPRFLRQGDEIALSTKIVNLSEGTLSGTASIEIVDALTGKPLDVAFRVSPAGGGGLPSEARLAGGGKKPEVAFSIAKSLSTSASWTIHVPESRYEPVIIRIRAQAGNFTDGEENTLPVLTNRMLVTETLPLWMNGVGTKTFSFDKLKASPPQSPRRGEGGMQGPRDTANHAFPNTSSPSGGGREGATLTQHGLTIEYTSNPAWLAVKALPYLMEFPYECAEQTFNRYYANALAAHILDKAPKVKAIFKKWQEEANSPTLGGGRGEAFKSPLEQNEELKSALLEETPWVLEAQSESQQRKNIALLFETSKLAADLDKAARKLEDLMLPEGGWPWFKGNDRPDRFITQYIVTGIGRLQHLGVQNERLQALAEKALPYLDRKMEESYRELLRNKADMKAQHIGYTEAQYGYMRSFFKGIPARQLSDAAQAFYKKQAQEFWPKFNPYGKGMLALALYRSADKPTSATIIQSLKETSIQKEELGMYWMEKGRSWRWQEAPIEAQSLLIECFREVADDDASVDKMKRWLLKQKQTQNWGTTKATADACYALLLQGTQWLTTELQVSIQLGDSTLHSADMPQEAGSGYFKVNIPGKDVQPDMGNITLNVSTSQPVNVSSSQPSWGAVYWQYFENLDKISSAATPLQVKKQLFIERNSDRGPVLVPISNSPSLGGGRGEALKVGDKVKARIEIIVDRDMEYVHLKDGRASCFEPTNVLSGYRWQGGLGYYESTRDASSNFFFSYLPKGKYVFEYPMFVTNAGDFSAGLATIQCMYAPEFSAHSEGVRVRVK